MSTYSVTNRRSCRRRVTDKTCGHELAIDLIAQPANPEPMAGPQVSHGAPPDGRASFVLVFAVFAGWGCSCPSLVSFSVRVDGESMHPDPARRRSTRGRRPGPEQAGVSTSTEGAGGARRVVKRVIGMPGDSVAMAGVRDDPPQVWLLPAGENRSYASINPTGGPGRWGPRPRRAPRGHVARSRLGHGSGRPLLALRRQLGGLRRLTGLRICSAGVARRHARPGTAPWATWHSSPTLDAAKGVALARPPLTPTRP